MCWISLLRQCNLQLICVMYFMTVFVWKDWFLITVCNLGAILWYKYSIPHRHLELGLLSTNIWLFFDSLCAIFFASTLICFHIALKVTKQLVCPLGLPFFLHMYLPYNYMVKLFAFEMALCDLGCVVWLFYYANMAEVWRRTGTSNSLEKNNRNFSADKLSWSCSW